MFLQWGEGGVESLTLSLAFTLQKHDIRASRVGGKSLISE